jgi:hypothetical protein
MTGNGLPCLDLLEATSRTLAAQDLAQIVEEE